LDDTVLGEHPQLAKLQSRWDSEELTLAQPGPKDFAPGPDGYSSHTSIVASPYIKTYGVASSSVAD
jgi:hypothetical protein